MNEPNHDSKSLYYQLFKRQYPAWMYTIAMALFALGIYIWIKFFLVVPL